MPGASISGAPVSAAPSGPAGGILSGTYPNPAFAAADAPMLSQAQTPVGGFALQDATPTIISWTAPNDGKEHRAMVAATFDVTSAMTGGGVNVNFTPPAGAASSYGLTAGGLAGGTYNTENVGAPVVIGPGTTVSVVQSTALTAGAATVWAEIWGS